MKIEKETRNYLNLPHTWIRLCGFIFKATKSDFSRYTKTETQELLKEVLTLTTADTAGATTYSDVSRGGISGSEANIFNDPLRNHAPVFLCMLFSPT